ncbi:EndoS/ChiA family endoglycosidase [Fodinibius saliphilus]|uniref:EndoS/ChiA family endoglycosidase n=1 Tax=Fodinibius saliphilus TaxID=1920650 RepID=UPI001107B64D|nr:glycosyl hydrolase family 18 protein [Fodinibius saliphilus]
MGWTKKSDVAQYKKANWKNFIKKEPDCPPPKAKRIALQNPEISFFFYCRDNLILEGPVYENHGPFNKGDAIFFSGEPWYGDAPQCDSYQKEGMSIAYVSPNSSEQFLESACYLLDNGSPAIDVVCIFAGNLVLNKRPYLKAHNDPSAKNPFNANIMEILSNGSVQKLQKKGITVLLTILGGHHKGGWSNFKTESAAADFATYLKTEVVDKYGLDGIDIDDEYSNPNLRIPNSLVTVTTKMKELMPDKIISKALFRDTEYFKPKYKGKTLADTLTYGWEMSYGISPEYRLPKYVKLGMVKHKLSLGFVANRPSRNPVQDVKWLKKNGYEGIMIYNFFNPQNTKLMGKLVNTLYGPGNWNKEPEGSSLKEKVHQNQK